MAEALRHWEQSSYLQKRQCDCLTILGKKIMKKLKKFILRSDVYRLTNIEQMNVVGGNTASTTGCGDKSYDTCSGTCYYEGYEGSCVWVTAYSSCKCATITIG